MGYYMGYIVFVPSNELDSALNVYKEMGDKRSRRIFRLSHPQGHLLANRRAFYDTVAATFPLNPRRSEEFLAKYWMPTLIDSFHGGIRGVKEEIIDIVWPDVDLVVQESVPAFVYILGHLEHVLDGFREVHADRNVYTRILLVYREGQPGFTNTPFWE